MRKKILDISPSVTYKGIEHAGGKVQYFYLKKIEETDDLTFLTTIAEEDQNKFEINKINGNYFVLTKHKGVRSLYDLLFKSFIKIKKDFIFDRFDGLLPYDSALFFVRKLRELKKSGYKPDIVILEWTEIAFLISYVKKLFPNAYIICHEVDVTFLRYERIYKNERKLPKKLFYFIRYKRIIKDEVNSMKMASKILVLNEKDKKLLVDKNIDNNKIKVIVPYFDLYSENIRRPDKNTIIFYGAMNRPFNCEAVEWFINKVLPLLDKNIKLIVIGNKPLELIKKYNSERITITGFVEDVSPYFSNCLCLVAPLFNGAGIKIKVLEAMSAGIPVLTSEVGIEGIPAENGKEFFLCKNEQDYVDVISKLTNVEGLLEQVSINAKKFIKDKFCYKNESYI